MKWAGDWRVLERSFQKEHLQNLWVQLTVAIMCGAIIYYYVSNEIAAEKKAAGSRAESASPVPSPALAKSRRQQQRKVAKEEEEDEEEEEQQVEEVAAPAARPSTNTEKKRMLEEESRKAREFMKQALPPLRLAAGAASPKSPGAKRGPKPKISGSSAPASALPPPSDSAYEPGAVVTVAYRSEVGEPVKPGGEARITSAAWDDEDATWRYNVTYYLGGREMGVAEAFLSAESSLTSGGVKRVRTPSKKVGTESAKKAKK